MSDKLAIGIDLGTTHSLICVLQAGVPTLIRNATGGVLTPSAVGVDDDGSLLVGQAALARATTHPELTALNFKRDMGTGRPVQLGRHTLRPEELSGAVLRALKQDAEQALGRPIEEAVITVPAYFGDLQRQATRDAGAIAGLRVERIVNEPTAAALAHGLHHLDEEMRVAVLDLGGGTFDVTVLEILEGVIEIQSSAGDTRLGGEDFRAALADHVTGLIARDHGAPPDGAPRTRARLLGACEAAKRRLSSDPSATLALPALPLADGRAVDVEVTVPREDAERIWQPVLDRLRGPIHRALRDAGLTPTDVDHVLLVGGATRMPAVAALAASIFERLPSRELPPDEAVAHGAAIQAGLKHGDSAVDDLVVTDVAPFSLGVAVGTKMGTRTVEGLFSPILERGCVIPTSRVDRFYPLEEGQRSIRLEIYQGEHALCADNQLLGTLDVPLPRRVPTEKQGVDVRFTYDLNGLLEVEATAVETGTTRSVVIEQRPGALSRKEIAAARKAMAALKFHPRESLPNRTAMARADALHAELTGVARSILQQAVTQFQVALDSQDPRDIDAAREQLLAVIDQLQ